MRRWSSNFTIKVPFLSQESRIETFTNPKNKQYWPAQQPYRRYQGFWWEALIGNSLKKVIPMLDTMPFNFIVTTRRMVALYSIHRHSSFLFSGFCVIKLLTNFFFGISKIRSNHFDFLKSLLPLCYNVHFNDRHGKN